MKKGYGFLAVIGVLATMSHYATGFFTAQPLSATDSISELADPALASASGYNLADSPPALRSEPEQSSCKEFDQALSPDRRTYPNPENTGEARRVVDTFAANFDGKPARLGSEVTYAIALAPDPIHTNLGLLFDRQIAALQQAAQDADFDYDSAWLPWQKPEGGDLSFLGDRQIAHVLMERRESCPGILLFRRHLTANSAAQTNPAPTGRARAQATLHLSHQAYSQGLVVLLVGEQPTGGINVRQWNFAVRWIARQSNKHLRDGWLRVLGPQFSGSFPSLLQVLPTSISAFRQVTILSGAASSRGEVLTFQAHLLALQNLLKGSQLHFGSFNENDERLIDQFMLYLRDVRACPSDAAIVAEDETAYARPSEAPPGKSIANSDPRYAPPSSLAGLQAESWPHSSNCRDDEISPPSKVDNGQPYINQQISEPLSVSFPRDISSLREAYEKQLVFESIPSRDHPIRAVLHPEPGAAHVNGLDTLPEYGGEASALDEEARLFGIVDTLRVHHIVYLILRSTNPQDMIFLARFFHRAYPEAHIVTVGSDLLFRREIDTAEFRGDMSLSSYPLLPRLPQWVGNDQSYHQIFYSNITQGTYMACRYLFARDDSFAYPQLNTHSSFSYPRPKVDNSILSAAKVDQTLHTLEFPALGKLPPYQSPLWAPTDLTGRANPKSFSPPAFLSVLGREGFWPLSVLQYQQWQVSQQDPETSSNAGMSTMVRFAPQTGNTIERSTGPVETHQSQTEPGLFGRPLATKVCIYLAVLLAFYQIFGLFNFGPATSGSLSFVFHNNPRIPSQGFLRGGLSFFAVLPLIELNLTRLILFPSERYRWPAWIVYAAVFVTFAVLIKLPITEREPVIAGTRDHTFDYYLRSRKRARLAATCTFVALLSLLIPLTCHIAGKYPPVLYALVYRMEHITSGTSPLLPLLMLSFGAYFWLWHVMAGNLMLGTGRPLLPQAILLAPKDTLWLRLHAAWEVGAGRPGVQPEPFWTRAKLVWKNAWSYFFGNDWKTETRGRYIQRADDFLTTAKIAFNWFIGVRRPKSVDPALRLPQSMVRLSDELGYYVCEVASPLFFTKIGLLILLGVTIFAIHVCYHDTLSYMTLEGPNFNFCLTWLLVACSLLTLVEAFCLYLTWAQLRRLLLAFGKTWLRESMTRFQPIRAISLLTATTNIHRVQYRIFWQQLNALKRFRNSSQGQLIDPAILKAIDCGNLFVIHTRNQIDKGIARYWWMPFDGDPEKKNIREIFRDAANCLITQELKPVWKKSTASPYAKTSDPVPVPPLSPRMDAAEEFVWVHIMGFVHVVIARMRTMTVSMAILFVTACFTAALYPLVPHTYVDSFLMLNFALIGATVAYVYAGMDRNDVLSETTATTPGRLGAEFWTKYVGFLIGPLIGIFATQFPSAIDTIIGWLQPGLGLGK